MERHTQYGKCRSLKIEAGAVEITVGSGEVPGRKGLWQETGSNNNNNNNNNMRQWNSNSRSPSWYWRFSISPFGVIAAGREFLWISHLRSEEEARWLLAFHSSWVNLLKVHRLTTANAPGLFQPLYCLSGPGSTPTFPFVIYRTFCSNVCSGGFSMFCLEGNKFSYETATWLRKKGMTLFILFLFWLTLNGFGEF